MSTCDQQWRVVTVAAVVLILMNMGDSNTKDSAGKIGTNQWQASVIQIPAVNGTENKLMQASASSCCLNPEVGLHKCVARGQLPAFWK